MITYLVRTPPGGIRLVRAVDEEQLRAYLQPIGDPPPTWRKATDDDLYMFRSTLIEDALPGSANAD